MPHLLKRLELNGFKSFAQKTTLEFPRGITAIVGPNGSGKSNVIDAIRWLLGERDAKSLRGARAEDLIFAGTPKRPRMGLAQAGLYFENHEHFFPTDASEVAIARRVGRDGNNQYTLNGEEVRLKDLVDFFAKARMGTRGLTVVTQGNSDVFIRSSPAVRREMIEEILGLKEYRLKKTEAERRLHTTRVNLEKAQAVMEEVAPHLRSLRRQANRFEKRGIVEQELRDVEDKFFGTRWGVLENDLTGYTKKIADHAARRVELAEGVEKAQKRVKDVEVREPKERARLREVKKQIQKLLIEQAKTHKDLGRLEVKLEFSRDEQDTARLPSVRELLALLGGVRKRLEEAMRESDAEGLRRAMAGALKDIRRALESVLPEEKEIGGGSSAAAELGLLKEGLQKLERDLGALKKEEEQLEASSEAFYEEFKSAVAEHERAKDVLEEWERAHRELQFSREKVELRLQDLEHDISQVGRDPAEIRRLTVTRANMHELPELERRALKLRSELAAIGEIDEAIVKEARETRERYEFLGRECADLAGAVKDLRGLIDELNAKIHTEFVEALVRINEEFQKFFELMFGGGKAVLKIGDQRSRVGGHKRGRRDEESGGEDGEGRQGDEKKEEEQGVDIVVKLPRKRVTTLEMLSGGERSLVGIAALFALISVSPPPFLVLDEIDAALDNKNARRFADILKEFSKETQFVVVTHNRATMEVADVLYGVTLNEDSTSKVVSLKLES